MMRFSAVHLLASLLFPVLVTASIRIDGLDNDWDAVTVQSVQGALTPPLRPGSDLFSLEATHDAETLYLKIQYNQPYPATQPRLSLYLDSDGDPLTGFSYLTRGIDLTWDLPADEGSVVGIRNLRRGTLLLRSAYNPDRGLLELAFPVSMLPAARWGGAISLAAVDPESLDRIPAFGSEPFLYHFKEPVRRQDPPESFEKRHPRDLRILSWNVLRDAPLNPAREDLFGRVLQATRPDIICFQEMYEASTPWAIALVNRWIPLEEGFWTARKQFDCITVSRFPIEATRAVDNNLITEIDTRDLIGMKSWIFNAHLPCCDNTAGRLAESDKAMSFLRDRMSQASDGNEEPFAIFLVGDMNTGSSEREMLTLIEGSILQTHLHGPAFSPDWDGTGLTDVAALQTHERRLDTWRSLNNRSNASRLDYFFFSDSLLLSPRSFVFNSRRVPPSFLDAHGLTPADTDGSDHLPVFADFRRRSLPAPWAGRLLHGSGWLPDSWMGPLFFLDFPSLYSPRHGWLHLADSSSPEGGWFFSPGAGWFWTGPAAYPWFYSHNSRQWRRF